MSRPQGIAVVGCGNVSVRYHLPAYARIPDRVRVVALADVSAERLAEAVAAYGGSDIVTASDWRDVVTRPDVDIVDIATPPRLHAEIAAAAAAAGKHVLCEKPITTIPAEAARMIDGCRAAGVTLGVWHNWAFYPEVRAAESIVASGEVGAVRLAIADYLGVPDIPGAGETGRTWRHDPATAGGGVLMDMLHCLYITERMMGRDAQRVSAWISGNAGHPHVEATALCRLETDGPVALVNVGWGRGPGGVFIEGTDGTVEMRWEDGGTGPFVPLARMEVRAADGTRRQVDVEKETLPEIHVRAMRDLVIDFVDAIEAGREPRMSGADGLHALEVTLAAYASATLGRTIEVPLSPDDPLFREGVAAIPRLDGPTWSPVRRQGLFAPQPPE